MAEIHDDGGFVLVLPDVGFGPLDTLLWRPIGAPTFVAPLPNLCQTLHVAIENRQQAELRTTVLAVGISGVADSHGFLSVVAGTVSERYIITSDQE